MKNKLSYKICNKCKGLICTVAFTHHYNACNGVKFIPYKLRVKKIRGIDYDPNSGYKTGEKVIWNKGLTKETDNRVKRIGEVISDGVKTGRIKSRKGLPIHSSAFKLKQSINAKKHNLGGNISKKHIYYNGVFLQSDYEVKIAKSLDDNKIKWIRPIPFLWRDKVGKEHRYYPDFYLPDYLLYLDPKNDYLIKKDRDKIESVINQNKIKLLVLNKNQLNWETLKLLIDSCRITQDSVGLVL